MTKTKLTRDDATRDDLTDEETREIAEIYRDTLKALVLVDQMPDDLFEEFAGRLEESRMRDVNLTDVDMVVMCNSTHTTVWVKGKASKHLRHGHSVSIEVRNKRTGQKAVDYEAGEQLDLPGIPSTPRKGDGEMN